MSDINRGAANRPRAGQWTAAYYFTEGGGGEGAISCGLLAFGCDLSCEFERLVMSSALFGLAPGDCPT
jgi:hypothetical protein